MRMTAIEKSDDHIWAGSTLLGTGILNWMQVRYGSSWDSWCGSLTQKLVYLSRYICMSCPKEGTEYACIDSQMPRGQQPPPQATMRSRIRLRSTRRTELDSSTCGSSLVPQRYDGACKLSDKHRTNHGYRGSPGIGRSSIGPHAAPPCQTCSQDDFPRRRE